MSDKNLHCDIGDDLIRRGGRKNRPSLFLPGNIDGAVGQPRGNIRRKNGEQPRYPQKLGGEKLRVRGEALLHLLTYQRPQRPGELLSAISPGMR